MSDSKKSTTPSKDSKKDDKSKSAQESKDAKDQDGKETSKGTQVVDLGFLEADDDFEEFPAEEWNGATGTDGALEDEERINIWEDNWDDDNVEADFSKQLKYVYLCFERVF